MSRAASNRQVFVVEDDDYDPSSIDNYSTRKRSQEEFYPKKQSARMSVKEFTSFKQDEMRLSDKLTSFVKTPKGLAITVACVAIGVLALIGGLAGLMYFLGNNVTQPNTSTNTGLADPSTLDSSVLTFTEKTNLIALGNFKSFSLLYRASRDGFFMNVFHRLCDPRTQTVSVIRSHVNSVFGGYTAQTWSQHGMWKTDTTAFLFSLRRRGIANNERFNVTNVNTAIYTRNDWGPTFGSGHDFIICDNPDILQCSTSSYCSGYQCPPIVVTPNMYLAGVQTFNVTEIEVYQVTF